MEARGRAAAAGAADNAPARSSLGSGFGFRALGATLRAAAKELRSWPQKSLAKVDEPLQFATVDAATVADEAAPRENCPGEA
jgi:hypothetical protein